MYSNAEIQELLHSTTSPYLKRAGVEGVVFPCRDGLAIKLQHQLAMPSKIIPPKLAERRRRCVHGFFSELLANRPLSSYEIGERISFLTLSQASHDSGHSIGMFRFISGQTVKRPSPSMYNTARQLGAMIDTYGVNNIIKAESDRRHGVILETFDGIHVEGLMQLQALKLLNADHYRRALYYFTWSLLLDGVSPYPTTPYNRLRDLPETVSYRYLPSRFWRVVCNNYNAYQYTSDLDALNEVDRLRRLFGSQFFPMPFDYEGFSNRENFGIGEGLCADIQELKSKIAPAVMRVIEAAQAGKSAL
jgi:hypothetical protein